MTDSTDCRVHKDEGGEQLTIHGQAVDRQFDAEYTPSGVICLTRVRTTGNPGGILLDNVNEDYFSPDQIRELIDELQDALNEADLADEEVEAAARA